jgi:hypothetical protein
MFLVNAQDDPVLATPGAAEALQLVIQGLEHSPGILAERPADELDLKAAASVLEVGQALMTGRDGSMLAMSPGSLVTTACPRSLAHSATWTSMTSS